MQLGDESRGNAVGHQHALGDLPRIAGVLFDCIVAIDRDDRGGEARLHARRFAAPQAGRVMHELRRQVFGAQAKVHGVAVKVRVHQLGVNARRFRNPDGIGGEGNALSAAARALGRQPFVIVTGHSIGEHDAIADDRDIRHAFPSMRILDDVERKAALLGELLEQIRVVRRFGDAMRKHVLHDRGDPCIATHHPRAVGREHPTGHDVIEATEDFVGAQWMNGAVAINMQRFVIE